ncbi:Flp family type IVb pilin [Devosia sp.]|uniref:Flp family type IVb pilin n=1 Tax=Devosia sp. TaxID=1871048 RepID=UPI002F0C9235
MRALVADRSGATAIEYGLIAALVAIGIIAALTLFGDTMSAMFNYVSDTAGGAMGTGG